MLELAAAGCGGLSVSLAVFYLAGPPEPDLRAPSWVSSAIRRRWAAFTAIVSDAGVPWLDAPALVALGVAAAVAGGAGAALATGLPAMSVAGAAGVAGTLYGIVRALARRRRAELQDAVLDAVRMLRQLLETGATSINQAVAILADRGPLPLRDEFRQIAARSVGRRQAWKDARGRVAEPLFDMLAAAVLVQRPGGGELVPLFADLEASVTAAQEVEREARALQAQARSASTIIVSLPLVFLTVLSAMRSPYLDAFRHPAGQAFLLAMLAVMASGYLWMRRLLELEGVQRVRLNDA